MKKEQFQNKNILVTGGSKGIGKAISKKLASLGANLFIVARNFDQLKTTQNEIFIINPNIICHIFSANVSNYEQVKLAVKEMVKKMGNIDGLINNAGSAYPEYFEKTPIETFESAVKINYLGAVYFTKEVYPYLQPGSFVSFTSSVAGFMGVFGYSSYAGTKFALIGFAETLQLEFSPKKIQVSVLCPPDTETPGFEIENQTKPFETKEISKTAKKMKPEQVAEEFIRQIAKGRFIINVNFESRLLYRLHGWMPTLTQKITGWMIKRIQKKKERFESSHTLGNK